MMNILIGDLAFACGIVVLLLPLLLTELSRPRDQLIGGLLLFFGLVLVTSNDRMNGATSLAVFSGAILIGRLGWEVVISRWQQLSFEEKNRFSSLERWSTSFNQLKLVIFTLFKAFVGIFGVLKPKPKKTVKKWVRPQNDLTEEEPISTVKDSSA